MCGSGGGRRASSPISPDAARDGNREGHRHEHCCQGGRFLSGQPAGELHVAGRRAAVRPGPASGAGAADRGAHPVRVRLPGRRDRTDGNPGRGLGPVPGAQRRGGRGHAAHRPDPARPRDTGRQPYRERRSQRLLPLPLASGLVPQPGGDGGHGRHLRHRGRAAYHAGASRASELRAGKRGRGRGQVAPRHHRPSTTS